MAEGQQAVAGEGKHSPAEGLHRGEADELQDDERADGEDDAAAQTEAVVEYLRHGLFEVGREDFGGVAHAEG